jgi:hypothetical protein
MEPTPVHPSATRQQRRPDCLTSTLSPIKVGLQRTDMDRDPGDFRERFRRDRALAFSDLIDAALFGRLLQLCDRAEFVVDTLADVARRQLEVPGTAGNALALALKRPELLRWLEKATGCGPLNSTFGRVVQNTVGKPHHLDWHDDLPEDPMRRLGITVNLGQKAYEGGLFELRVKKTRQIVVRHRHVEPGSALMFEVSNDLEHRVWPITDGGPRRIFAGWFLGAKDPQISPLPR